MALAAAPVAGQPADREGAIAELLEARAEAVRRGDRGAFVATIDPQATRTFRARQLRLFETWQQIPLDGYSLEADWDRYGDLAVRDLRRRHRAEEVALPVTMERYRIRGFDQADAVEELFLTFVQRGDEWFVAQDEDLDDVGIYSARHLWDFGAVETDRSANFRAFRHTCASAIGCVGVAPSILQTTETALGRMSQHWPAEWSGKVVVLIPTTTDELARMIQATFPLDNFVAFAYSTEDRSGGGLEYTGHRILLNPSAFAGRTGEAELNILAHELLHVASRELSGPFIPYFIEEGMAEYVGGGGTPRGRDYLSAQLSAGAVSGELPRDHEFLLGTGATIYLSYVESGSAMDLFAETYGEPALVRLYEDMGRRSVAPGTSRYHVDQAFRRVTGSSFRSFETTWADSIGA